MILIQSSESDKSTNDVIRWLLHYKAKFLRINEITEIHNIKYVNNHFIITTDDSEIDISKMKSYWYRRGEFKVCVKCPTLPFAKKFNNTYLKHLYRENEAVFQIMLNYLKNDIFCIGDSISCIYVNKNKILNTAKKLSLNVPEYIITNSLQDVINFKKRFYQIITKCINNTFHYSENNCWFPTYTMQITDEILESIYCVPFVRPIFIDF
jgi:hypothetical protein